MRLIRSQLLQACAAFALAAWRFDEGRGQVAREAVSGRLDPVAGMFNMARCLRCRAPGLALLGDAGDRVLALKVWQMAAIQPQSH